MTKLQLMTSVVMLLASMIILLMLVVSCSSSPDPTIVCTAPVESPEDIVCEVK